VEYALALVVLLALVALVVARPLARRGAEQRSEDARLAELEAAKESKYREIRDAELDHRMGKLGERDWHALDRELREEAIAILRELDRLRGEA
jgi:hypothetical protein